MIGDLSASRRVSPTVTRIDDEISVILVIVVPTATVLLIKLEPLLPLVAACAPLGF